MAAQPDVDVPAAVVDIEQGEAARDGGYKLVKSATGNNLYVEARDYDPLGNHRPKDKAANKGEGLWFMFPCCCPKADELEAADQAHTADRHYEFKPSPSMQNMTQNGVDKAL